MPGRATVSALRLIALFVGALMLVACGSEEAGPPAGGPPEGGGRPPALVRVDLVKQESVIQKRLVTGQLEPSQQSMVAAEEAGRVKFAPPDAGSFVKKGDRLAELDTTILDRQRQVADESHNTAIESIGEAKARLEQATSQRERFEALVKDGSVTENDYELAVRDEKVAEAQLKVANSNVAMRKAELELIDDRLGKMVIHAPFDGFVTEKHTEVGQWLGAGGSVVTLMQTDPIDAILDVPEAIVEQVKVGSTVELMVTGIEGLQSGSIHQIVPNADRRSRTFPVEVRLKNADRKLSPGRSVQAELPTGEAINGLTVHRDAVLTTPIGMQVYANRGGTAVPVPVQILFRVGDRFVVDAPLGPGEQVITEGNERVHPGRQLQVQDAPPATPPTTAAGN